MITNFSKVNGTDTAAGIGGDISLESIVVDDTERVAGGYAEGGTVIVALGERGGAYIALDGGTLTMTIDGTGRTAGSCGDISLEEFLKAMLRKSLTSIIKSASTSLSSTLSFWWTL